MLSTSIHLPHPIYLRYVIIALSAVWIHHRDVSCTEDKRDGKSTEGRTNLTTTEQKGEVAQRQKSRRVE